MKNKIYKGRSVLKVMNKRGAIEVAFVVVAAVIIASSAIFGSYVVGKNKIGAEIHLSEDKYVGDMKTKQAYDYKCLSYIPQDNRIIFNNLEMAKKEGYNYNPDCP